MSVKRGDGILKEWFVLYVLILLLSQPVISNGPVLADANDVT